MDTTRFILQSNIKYITKKDAKGDKQLYFKEQDSDSAVLFEISPLNRGYGNTLGNTLRRILMSSVPGSAIVSIRFEGVNHELSTISGVKDDILTIMTKLKRLRLRINSGDQANLYLEATKAGKVLAKDFKISGDAEILNKNMEITELTKDTKFTIECLAENGFGYLPVEDRQGEQLPEGFFAVDALFSPIRSVRYYVEDTRVGQITNLDKLILIIDTDGSVTPREALEKSATIMVTLADNLLNGVERSSLIKPDQSKEKEKELREMQEQNHQEDVKKLFVEQIGLSPRTQNALKNNNIMTVDDIEAMGIENLKSLKGVGGKAFIEIVERLGEIGIQLQ